MCGHDVDSFHKSCDDQGTLVYAVERPENVDRRSRTRFHHYSAVPLDYECFQGYSVYLAESGCSECAVGGSPFGQEEFCRHEGLVVFPMDRNHSSRMQSWR